MSIRGVTFNRQTCKSGDDALIYHMMLSGKSGRITGCEVTADSSNIYVQTGYFIIFGRMVQISGLETLEPDEVLSGVRYDRLVFTIDLSLENTTSEFNQGYFEFISSYESYQNLVQEDLLSTEGKYQIPIAKFKTSISGISSFTSEFAAVDINEIWNELQALIDNYENDFEEYLDEKKEEVDELVEELSEGLEAITDEEIDALFPTEDTDEVVSEDV